MSAATCVEQNITGRYSNDCMQDANGLVVNRSRSVVTNYSKIILAHRCVMAVDTCVISNAIKLIVMCSSVMNAYTAVIAADTTEMAAHTCVMSDAIKTIVICTLVMDADNAVMAGDTQVMDNDTRTIEVDRKTWRLDTIALESGTSVKPCTSARGKNNRKLLTPGYTPT